MAMYSAKEMKSKIGNGKSKVREMEVKDNKAMKLWIPKDEFIHLVKHFNIQNVEKFKHARSKAVTCINSDVDEEKKVCPVCDYIDSLWKQWRSTVDKDEKLTLQNKINRLIADFYYVNAVNVTGKNKDNIKELLKSGDYSDLKCESLRITPPIFKQICAIISPDDDEDGADIATVLWTYKKAVTGQTRYTITEDIGNPIALLLQKRIEQICGRAEKDGGYIDLDKGYNEHQEQKAYIAKLYGDEDEEDADVLDDDEDEAKPAKKSSAPKKAVKKEPEVEEDEEDVSLDDLDEEPVKPAKKPAKPASKKVVEEDDDLDIDDELEAGKQIEDIDPDEAPAPKKITPAKAAKKPSDDDDDFDIDDEEIDVKPAKKPAKPAPKKAVEEDDDFDDLDEEPKPAKKTPAPAKKPAVKKPVIDDDDDLEIDDDFDDEDI